MKILVCAHAKDSHIIEIYDDEGKTIYEDNNYLPYGLGLGGGDDTEIEVDVDTGQIIGWDAAKVKLGIAEAIRERQEEEEENERYRNQD